MSDLTSANSPTEPHRDDPTTTPTPTEPHHDVREEWAARLQCADVGVDFPWLTEDGCDVWLEQSEATQEHYRRLLDLALSAGLQIPPAAAVSAAAPDEREATPDEAHDIGYTKGHTDGYREAMAALAARPAPAVNAADVEKAAAVLLADYQQQYDGGQIEDFLDLARAVARALGLTVADEGRAEA